MRVKRQFMRCQWKYRDNLQSATVQVAALAPAKSESESEPEPESEAWPGFML